MSRWQRLFLGSARPLAATSAKEALILFGFEADLPQGLNGWVKTHLYQPALILRHLRHATPTPTPTPTQGVPPVPRRSGSKAPRLCPFKACCKSSNNAEFFQCCEYKVRRIISEVQPQILRLRWAQKTRPIAFRMTSFLGYKLRTQHADGCKLAGVHRPAIRSAGLRWGRGWRRGWRESCR